MSDHEHTDNKNKWNTPSLTTSNFTTPYRIGQNSSLSESGSLKVILDVEGQPEERERERVKLQWDPEMQFLLHSTLDWNSFHGGSRHNNATLMQF